jgi:hypothetical protein
MLNAPKRSGFRDNHFCGSVADFLKPYLQSGSRLSVVSAYLTIYTYEALKEHLDQIEHMDFLFGEPTFVKSLDPDNTEKKQLIIDADGLKLANALQQKRFAKDCAAWIGRRGGNRELNHDPSLKNHRRRLSLHTISSG